MSDELLAATLGFALAFDPTPRVNAAPSPSPHPHAKPHPSPTPAVVDEGCGNCTTSTMSVGTNGGSLSEWSPDWWVRMLMSTCAVKLHPDTYEVGRLNPHVERDAVDYIGTGGWLDRPAQLECHLDEDGNITLSLRMMSTPTPSPIPTRTAMVPVYPNPYGTALLVPVPYPTPTLPPMGRMCSGGVPCPSPSPSSAPSVKGRP